MGKAPKAVKWSIGADEPDDLDDFLSNDDIVARNTPKKGSNKGVTNWPSKGPHTFKILRATVKPNKNGDDRIAVMLVLQADKKSAAHSWNGYLIFDGFNVVEGPGLKFLKRWLKSMGLTWTDFITKSKQDDNDPPHLVQIGRVKIEGAAKPATLRATVKVAPADDYNDDEHLEIASYIPVEDEDDEPEEDEDEDVVDEDEDVEDEEDEDEDEDEEEDDEEEDEDEEDEDDEEDEEDEEEDEDEDEEDDEDAEEELREELNGMTKDKLSKRATRLAKKAKMDTDDLPTTKKKLVDWLVEQELNAPPF
jgi:hypothetical protein